MADTPTLQPPEQSSPPRARLASTPPQLTNRARAFDFRHHFAADPADPGLWPARSRSPPPPELGKKPDEFLFRRALPKGEPAEQAARRMAGRQRQTTTKPRAERAEAPSAGSAAVTDGAAAAKSPRFRGLRVLARSS